MEPLINISLCGPFMIDRSLPPHDAIWIADVIGRDGRIRFKVFIEFYAQGEPTSYGLAVSDCLTEAFWCA